MQCYLQPLCQTNESNQWILLLAVNLPKAFPKFHGVTMYWHQYMQFKIQNAHNSDAILGIIKDYRLSFGEFKSKHYTNACNARHFRAF